MEKFNNMFDYMTKQMSADDDCEGDRRKLEDILRAWGHKPKQKSNFKSTRAAVIKNIGKYESCDE